VPTSLRYLPVSIRNQICQLQFTLNQATRFIRLEL